MTPRPADELAIEVAEWYAEVRPVLDRAAADVKTKFERLIEDWRDEYGFEVIGEVAERVKKLPRLQEKLARYNMEDRLGEPDQCYGVSDLVGIRITVRCIDDIYSFKQAVEEQ